MLRKLLVTSDEIVGAEEQETQGGHFDGGKADGGEGAESGSDVQGAHFASSPRPPGRSGAATVTPDTGSKAVRGPSRRTSGRSSQSHARGTGSQPP